jgi:hypothetical protein
MAMNGDGFHADGAGSKPIPIASAFAERSCADNSGLVDGGNISHLPRA